MIPLSCVPLTSAYVTPSTAMSGDGSSGQDNALWRPSSSLFELPGTPATLEVRHCRAWSRPGQPSPTYPPFGPLPLLLPSFNLCAVSKS